MPPAGARLHRQLPEEGDAIFVWAGKEEGGAAHETAGDLHHPAERASHQPRRLPQRHQDAGTRTGSDVTRFVSPQSLLLWSK